MAMAMQNLSELIDRLDVAAKRELVAQLQYELRGTDVPSGSVNNAVWDAVLSVSEGRLPLATFSETYGKAKLKRDLDWLNEYSDSVCTRKLTVTERGSVLRLMLGCLADHLRTMETRDGRRPKVTPLTLMRNLDSLPMAVDWAFPGYAEARLIDRVALMRRAA